MLSVLPLIKEQAGASPLIKRYGKGNVIFQHNKVLRNFRTENHPCFYVFTLQPHLFGDGLRHQKVFQHAIKLVPHLLLIRFEVLDQKVLAVDVNRHLRQ